MMPKYTVYNVRYMTMHNVSLYSIYKYYFTAVQYLYHLNMYAMQKLCQTNHPHAEKKCLFFLFFSHIN